MLFGRVRWRIDAAKMTPAKNQCCGFKLPTYLGFALLGLVNAIVPFIVFSANYLIIPYPRWVVILIETLPALVTKLFLPHFLHRVPYWLRPLSAAACCILVAVITKATPPNVAPPVRVFTSMLASSVAAAMDVSFLGMTRYYGKAALSGWGAGVGAGALFCAVLPFVLTVWMEAFLRSFIDCIYALAGTMLFAFFVILPGAPVNYPDTRQNRRNKLHVEDGPESTSLLIYDPLEELTRLLSVENRLDLVQSMIRPLMLPLGIAFATQTIVFPGIARALPASPAFDSFFSYFTTYGFAFQLGGFMGRTLTPIFRARSTRLPFIIINLAAIILLANATFSIFTSAVLAGLLAWCAGLMGGAIYMIILGQVLEEKSTEPGLNQEFCLQVVGTGETAGVFIGGMLGAVVEMSICGGANVAGVGTGQRWCRT
ncbi:batten's disease protein Cln3 [Thelonectria olida]|uniref:Protein BTN n=1 Tax=Thelonectria olida TaxID=1576542 RepID=A0A9P8VYN8_9HYPO|nr:batten's disease protein Cln3 [Thelonectria olida]